MTTNLTPDSAFSLFTEKHPDATLKDAFTAAWQMCTVRSPEASDDAKYELYRRLYGLSIQNLRINEKLEVNWIALDCNGVSSSLEARSDAVQVPLPEWQTGIPLVPEGKCREFIIAVRRAQSNPPGKVAVFSANYANKFTDDGCLADRSGDEFIADGWYVCGLDMSGEYNEVFEPIGLNEGDEIVGWHALPKWSNAAPVAPAAPHSDHYQQLLGVAYVVLGCLAANGVDIPERFLDAFSDPDSVENPLELLPYDFSPAQAVRAAVQQAAPVAWSVYNGVCLDQIFMLRESADKYAANMQKSHDLSGSLAAFVVKPLYAAPKE